MTAGATTRRATPASDVAWFVFLGALWGVLVAVQVEDETPGLSGLLLLPLLAAGMVVGAVAAVVRRRRPQPFRGYVVLLLASAAAAQLARVDVRLGVAIPVLVVLVGAGASVYALRARGSSSRPDAHEDP